MDRVLVTNFKVNGISNNTVIESRDTTYFEDIFSYRNKVDKPISYEKPSSSTYVYPSKNLEKVG